MANERVLRTGDRAQRPERTPITGKRNVLTVNAKDKDPDFVYRIANDAKPGRVDELLEAGYEVCTGQVRVGDKRVATPGAEGSPVQVNLGRGEKGYLMRQRKEWYDEDQQAKQQAIAEQEQDMIRRAKQEHYGNIEIKRGGS